MMLTEIRSRSQITIPSEIIKKLNLKQGDTLDVDIEGDQIVLRPVIAIPKDQAYFWTKEWQSEEKQVQSDIENNKINFAKSKDELFEDLGL
ncbi:AbrB family transcriptional regulator [Desulfosporosinus sp. Tol-M]|nr:AbrB family transcriptional regulator [Desulfosporosinus sp. Tol-M]